MTPVCSGSYLFAWELGLEMEGLEVESEPDVIQGFYSQWLLPPYQGEGIVS